MPQRFWPILNTLLFTILVPGTVAILIPRWIPGGFMLPPNGAVTWIGGILFLVGTGAYLRCAGEFAVRGLGTPAPIAPTKFLVTTALHRYVRNPMYIGVAMTILGEAALPLGSRRRVRGFDAAHRSHLCGLVRGTQLAAPVRRIL